jgi:DNA-binding response OmpR family regulator
MPRILVIDDDGVIRRLAEDFLSDEGFEVLGADTATAGLEALVTYQPDLVLLDLRMPGMDGQAFCAHMGSASRAIPVLVLSGANDVHRVAAEIGAAGAIRKPFDLDNLQGAVRRLLPGGPV